MAELDGMFLEVETAVADEREPPAALAAVRAAPAGPGVPEADPAAELYAEAVAANRERSPRR
ncbi:hypothetical protein [Kitasatospora putterlickiae]|uniref:hypothetical protein n=1 Tax=Kitasatospora putterlickiae TaxID=221725 RepID=UPI0031CEC858